jgi:hypothetical protein
MDREQEANLSRLAGVISEQISGASTDQISTADLEKRFADLSEQVEIIAEDVGLSKQYHDQVRSRLDASTDDIKSIGTIRLAAACFAGFIILLSCLSVFYFLACPSGLAKFNGISDSHVRIAFIVGSLATIFGLTALLVKGAFASGKGLEGSGILPEHIKMFLELYRGNGGHN